MVRLGHLTRGAKVDVLGLTFKENCPDLRNSKVVDIIGELRTYGLEVHVHDPVADPAEALAHYGLALSAWEDLPRAEALVVAVAHADYVGRAPAEFAAKVCAGGTVIDVKSILDREAVKALGLSLWRL